MRRVFWLMLPLAAGTLFAGCGIGKGTSIAHVPKPKPTPIKAYVRIDALIARSPLQADVTRLRSAEERLRRLAREPADASVAAGVGGAYQLGALSSASVASPGVIAAARAARGARAIAEREQLRQTVGAALGVYEAERKRRQQQRIDQRRAELEAVDYSRAAERERLARETASSRALRDIDSVAAQALEVMAKLAVLHAQLGRSGLKSGIVEPGTFPPIVDRDQFEADVKAVIANPKVSFTGATSADDPKAHFIGMQARLEAKRLEQSDILKTLQEKLNQIHADAALRADKAAMAVAQQQLDEIERQLEALSDDNELQFQLRDQSAQLNDVLDSQSAITGRVVRVQDRLGAIGSAGGAGSVSYATLFGAGAARNDRAGATSAADRVAHQRERLERYIRVDIETAVRDAARARNVDVLPVSDAVIAAATTSAAKIGMAGGATMVSPVAGRKDMTENFVQWTKPGTPMADPSTGGAGAAVNSVLPPRRAGG